MVTRLLVTLVTIIMCASYAPLAYAESLPIENEQTTFVISELQVNGLGSGTTTQEYIELYNNSDSSVDVSSWSVVYRNSSDKESVLYTFDADTVLAPRSFMVGKNSATATTYLPEVTADFLYTLPSYGLPASSGSLVIKNANLELVDEVSWNADTKYINDSTVVGLTNGSSIQRICADSITLITNLPAINSYHIDTVSPLSLNCKLPAQDNDAPDNPETPPVDDAGINQDTAAQDPIAQPARERLPILINELFVDPEPPLTDTSDEYIELYNPNDTQLDLAGYTIVAGTTTKYRYTFPSGSYMAPRSYIALTSAVTPLSLSNSGASVELLNDLQQQVDAVTYGKSNAGEAWARNTNGEWQWTSSPTLAAPNIMTIKPLTTPAVVKTTKKATSTAKTSKKITKAKTNYSVALPIQLNEIFPNPASPQTDASDEFIELYNPHPMAINITDYTITAGATKQYSYTFPEGSVIAPGGYIIIDSANTTISLSNEGGTVRLINNFDTEIDKVSYDAAQSGQSYARDDANTWRWTTTITKNAKNEFTASTPAAAKNKITKVSSASTSSDVVAVAPAPQPVPGWVLAVLGVSAVCYAAYEYRFEVRNSFYKFRANRRAG